MTRPRNKRKPLEFGVRVAPGWSDGYSVSEPVYEATIGATSYSANELTQAKLVMEEPDHDD